MRIPLGALSTSRDVWLFIGLNIAGGALAGALVSAAAREVESGYLSWCACGAAAVSDKASKVLIRELLAFYCLLLEGLQTLALFFCAQSQFFFAGGGFALTAYSSWIRQQRE